MKKTKTKASIRSYERKANEVTAITPIEYGGLQEAYDHFNRELFEGSLPDVFITYMRHAHSRGHFAADRYAGRFGKLARHELALNPDHFVDRTDEQICSTLTHEMAHVWQQAHGSPSSRAYHNKEWAAKMKSIGLQPSSTGAPGGKETGANVSHYIIPDGAFQKAFEKLAATGWKLNLQSAHRPGPKGGSAGKDPFRCPSCGQNAWGKPKLDVTCTPCLRGVLEAAGIDPAVIEPARMKSATEVAAALVVEEAPRGGGLDRNGVKETASLLSLLPRQRRGKLEPP